MVICRLGHTVAELRYRDADGRARWHVFDPQHGWYVFARDGGHVASLAEINAEPDLLLDPKDPPRPWFYAWSRHERYRDREQSVAHPAYGRSPAPKHRMRLDLRRGERWTRLWSPGPQYWPYAYGPKPMPITHVWVEQDVRGGGIADDYLGEYVEPYLYRTPRRTWLLHAEERTPRCRMPGTVELRYAVPLADGGFREGAANCIDLAGEKRASTKAATLHPAKAGRLGQIVYEVNTPYVITDARIDALVRTGLDEQDVLAFYVSTDGGASWEQVWGNMYAERKRATGGPRHASIAFGNEAHRAGKFSVVGKYSYQVRVDFLASRRVETVGLDELVLTTNGLCGMMVLPALQPGSNRVSVAVRKPPARSLRLHLEYEWSERGRGARRFSTRLPATGGIAIVRVSGCRPRDVRMRAVSLELV